MSYDQLLHRRGTAAAWATANPVLGAGEIGYESDTGKFKVGNGGALWNAIGLYFAPIVTAAMTLSLAGASIAASQPIIDASQTWNNGAVAFTGVKANFVDTASAAGSLLMDLQKDSVSKFSVGKTGESSIAVGVGGLFNRPPGSSLNAVNWRHIVNQNPFANGGVGNEAYANEVTAFGWNLSDIIGVPAVAGKAACWDNWEYKYSISNRYFHERHMETLDTNGVQHRWFSSAIPHDGGTGSGLLIAVDTINFYNFAGTQIIKWDIANLASFVNYAYTFNYAINNYAPHKQRNAANNAFLNLPYYDADDRMYLGASAVVVGGIPSGGTYAGNGFVVNCTGGASGNTVGFFAGPSLTGSLYGIVEQASPTGDFIHAVYNNRNASGANAAIELRVIGASAGDPVIRFNVNGSTQWQVGLDNSDNDTFKINTAALGSSDKFTLDTSGNMAVTGVVKPGSFTVTGLPSAATAGQGAMAWVTDANATTARSTVAGGGSNKVLVASDGTNWIIMG